MDRQARGLLQGGRIPQPWAWILQVCLTAYVRCPGDALPAMSGDTVCVWQNVTAILGVSISNVMCWVSGGLLVLHLVRIEGRCFLLIMIGTRWLDLLLPKEPADLAANDCHVAHRRLQSVLGKVSWRNRQRLWLGEQSPACLTGERQSSQR